MAIHRVLIDSIDDFYKLDFIEKNQTVKAICADPTRADNISHLISGRNIYPITIAQFVKELIKKENSDLKIYRKSELFLELSVIWKKAGGKQLFNTFNAAFNLFTDYRGFTNNIELIEEILGEHPDELAQALRWFYAYMDLQQILDEQAAYKKCAEILENQNLSEESYIFVGFSHFSAMQLELLNSLGTKTDIFIPAFRELEDELISTDWAFWLNTMGAEKLELSSKDLERKAKVFTYPKGYLSETLKNNVSNADKTFIFSKNSDIKDYLEADISQGFFKVQTDLFSMYIPELEKLEWSDKNLESKIEEYSHSKNFVKLKLYLVLCETINHWRNISDENKEINDFDKKIILEILKLNLPRVSNIPVGKKSWNSAVVDLSRVETLDPSEKVCICVKNKGISLAHNNEAFSEKVKTFLVALGPIRNIKRERNQLQSYVKGFLANENISFFIEDGTLEENLFWNELEISEYQKSKISKEYKAVDYLADKINRKEEGAFKASASRLQTFIDCPRKYYFSYLNKLDIQKVYHSKFDPAEMGVMLHEIIENHYKNGDHDQVIAEVMKKYSRNKKIDRLNWEESRLKLKLKSRNAHNFLRNLLNEDPNIEINFEKFLVGEEVSGRIDCTWKSDILGIGIVDFKSSAFGIPSKKEHLEFRKIQLWFYLNHCGLTIDDISYWGFVNTDEIAKSLMFSKKVNQISGIKTSVIDDLNLNEFTLFSNSLLAAIQNETIFPAKIESTSACAFCPVSNLCPKGDTNE